MARTCQTPCVADEPESLGTGLGPLLADYVPLMPSGARRAGAARVMAARIGRDPSFLVSDPIKTQLAALGIGAVGNVATKGMGAPTRTAATILPILLTQLLRRHEMKSIQEDYDEQDRKRLSELDTTDMFGGIGGSSRLGAVGAYEAMRKRKYQDIGHLSEAGDALTLATGGLALPVTSWVDHRSADRLQKEAQNKYVKMLSGLGTASKTLLGDAALTAPAKGGSQTKSMWRSAARDSIGDFKRSGHDLRDAEIKDALRERVSYQMRTAQPEDVERLSSVKKNLARQSPTTRWTPEKDGLKLPPREPDLIQRTTDADLKLGPRLFNKGYTNGAEHGFTTDGLFDPNKNQISLHTTQLPGADVGKIKQVEDNVLAHEGGHRWHYENQAQAGALSQALMKRLEPVFYKDWQRSPFGLGWGDNASEAMAEFKASQMRGNDGFRSSALMQSLNSSHPGLLGQMTQNIKGFEDMSRPLQNRLTDVVGHLYRNYGICPISKQAGFADQKNSPTIPLYLAAALASTGGLAAANAWTHYEDANNQPLDKVEWAPLVRAISGKAPPVYDGGDMNGNAFYTKPTSDRQSNNLVDYVAGLEREEPAAREELQPLRNRSNERHMLINRIMGHGVVVADSKSSAGTLAHEAGHAKIENTPGVLQFLQRYVYPYSHSIAPLAGVGSMAAGLASGSTLNGALLGTGIGLVSGLGTIAPEAGASYYGLKGLNEYKGGALTSGQTTPLVAALSTYLAAGVLPSTLSGAAGGWISGMRRKKETEDEDAEKQANWPRIVDDLKLLMRGKEIAKRDRDGADRFIRQTMRFGGAGVSDAWPAMLRGSKLLQEASPGRPLTISQALSLALRKASEATPVPRVQAPPSAPMLPQQGMLDL